MKGAPPADDQTTGKRWEIAFHGYRNSWVVKRFKYWLTARVYMFFACTDMYELRERSDGG